MDNFRCDICSEEIPIHLKIQHKSMHKTEREFEKGLEKGKVQKTKRQDVEKTVKKKTGYMLFCSAMRPVLKQSHNPSAKQMMSLLGIEWGKQTRAEKQEWNNRAAEESSEPGGSESGENTRELAQPSPQAGGPAQAQSTIFTCPFCDINMVSKSMLKDHIAETHLQIESNKGGKTGNQLNRIPVPVNQERISKCDVCGKMVNRNELQRHMDTNHCDSVQDFAPDTDLVDEVEDNDYQTTHDEHQVEDNDNQTTQDGHRVEDNDDQTTQEEHETTVDQIELKVVMVKRKTIWWPGQVINESNDQTEVQLLNKQKTKLTVSNANIKPFAVDHGQMQGMKRDWRDAYMKAMKLVQK